MSERRYARLRVDRGSRSSSSMRVESGPLARACPRGCGRRTSLRFATPGVDAEILAVGMTYAVERWRNPSSHGGFEKGHAATIHLHAPDIGAVPVGLTGTRNSPHFSLFPESEGDVASVFAFSTNSMRGSSRRCPMPSNGSHQVWMFASTSSFAPKWNSRSESASPWTTYTTLRADRTCSTTSTSSAADAWSSREKLAGTVDGVGTAADDDAKVPLTIPGFKGRRLVG